MKAQKALGPIRYNKDLAWRCGPVLAGHLYKSHCKLWISDLKADKCQNCLLGEMVLTYCIPSFCWVYDVKRPKTHNDVGCAGVLE